jgi:hypothetical protein
MSAILRLICGMLLLMLGYCDDDDTVDISGTRIPIPFDQSTGTMRHELNLAMLAALIAIMYPIGMVLCLVIAAARLSYLGVPFRQWWWKSSAPTI